MSTTVPVPYLQEYEARELLRSLAGCWTDGEDGAWPRVHYVEEACPASPPEDAPPPAARPLHWMRCSSASVAYYGSNDDGESKIRKMWLHSDDGWSYAIIAAEQDRKGAAATYVLDVLAHQTAATAGGDGGVRGPRKLLPSKLRWRNLSKEEPHRIWHRLRC